MIIAIEYEQQQFSKFYNFSGGVMEKRKELTDSGKSRFRLRMPDTAALLLMIITVVAALTYIIPAGEFARVVDEETGRTLVQAGTYQSIASNPTTLKGYLSSVFRGILEASEIIAFIFVTGGAFGIVTRTGAITTGLENLVVKFKGKETILVGVIMTSFALCGTTFGMAEEALPFIVILVAVSAKLGFDPIVGVSMVVVGIYAGYSPGVLNPFNTGIAQGIAELPMFSGMGIRALLMAGSILIAVQHTISHGRKFKAENEGRTDSRTGVIFDEFEAKKLSGTDKTILFILVATIAGLMLGVLKQGWYLEEISGLFIAMGFVIGMIYYKGNFEKCVNSFIEGANEMATAALFVGFSRAILVIMQDGQIMDTLVYWMSIPLSSMSSIFAAWGIYFSQGIINFFIPSSTGQAVVVMPIISPLSDVIGITRQTAVLAFQAGDGFWNMITPTHSVLMASLGLAGVTFSSWFKFAYKLVIKWSIWVMAVLAFAVTINWGPF